MADPTTTVPTTFGLLVPGAGRLTNADTELEFIRSVDGDSEDNIMHGSNIARALRARHPLDVGRIRATANRYHPSPLSDAETEQLWSTFSRDRHAGDGWLPVIEESLDDFATWCKE